MSPRKTGQEAKVERLTWFAIIIAFLVMTNNGVDGAAIVTVNGLILAASAFYQWRKGWSVGPVTPIAAGLGFIGAYALYQPVPVDLSLLAFFQIVAVIGFGVLTRDS